MYICLILMEKPDSLNKFLKHYFQSPKVFMQSDFLKIVT